jgi:hypothetical protein
MKNEIILYRPDELAEHIEVWIEEETVWLSQQQMTVLFNQSKQNISLHINNCFKEGELKKEATVKDSLTLQSHDRFLIVDQNEVYHLGASLKDLGKRWFAFSKMDKTSVKSITDSISEL